MPLTPTPKANKILDLVDSRERRRQADLLTRPFDHPHRTPRHILRDFVRLVLPILFLALFLILATVVCIYTFVNRKTLPWSFVKGLGIAFAVVSAGWCIGKTYLYFLDKRRQDTAIHEFLAGERRKEDPGSELLDFMTPREVVCPLRFRRILPRAKRWVAWVWTKRPSGMKPKPVFSPERRIQRHDEYEERLREVWPGTWLRLAAERSARQVEHRRKTQQRNTVRWAPSSTREWSVSDEASIAARSSRSDQAKRRGISAALAPQMPSRLPKARTRKRGRKFEAGLSPIQECRQDSLGPISLEPRTLATPYDISGKPEYRLGTRLVLFSSPALHEKPTARGVNGLGISEQHSIFLDAPIGPEQNVAEARLPNADARKPIIPPPRSSSLRRKEVKVESTTSPSCSTRKCPLSFRFKDAYAAPARPDSPRPLRGSPPPLEISQETKPQPGLPSPATTLDDDAWYSSTESLLYEDEEEAAQPVAAAATSLRTSTPVLSVAPLSVSKVSLGYTPPPLPPPPPVTATPPLLARPRVEENQKRGIVKSKRMLTFSSSTTSSSTGNGERIITLEDCTGGQSGLGISCSVRRQTSTYQPRIHDEDEDDGEDDEHHSDKDDEGDWDSEDEDDDAALSPISETEEPTSRENHSTPYSGMAPQLPPLAPVEICLRWSGGRFGS